MQSSANNDEIDLFELIVTLWRGKRIIVAISSLFLIACFIYLLITPKQYESKITVANDTRPSFVGNEVLHRDFVNTLLQERNFSDWRNENANSPLQFDMVTDTELLEGYLVSKAEIDRDIVIEQNKSQTEILIRLNDLRLISDFYDYATFTNAVVTDKYLVRARNEISQAELQLDEAAALDNMIMERLVQAKLFVVDVKNGGKLFLVKRPTAPVKTAPRSFLIFALSLMLGGFVGAVVVLLRKSIQTYRLEQGAR